MKLYFDFVKVVSGSFLYKHLSARPDKNKIISFQQLKKGDLISIWEKPVEDLKTGKLVARFWSKEVVLSVSFNEITTFIVERGEDIQKGNIKEEWSEKMFNNYVVYLEDKE